MGPYVTIEAAQADYAARQAAKQQVPVPVQYEQRANGWYAYNAKWGPSVGWFQVRSLRKPELWGTVDKLRIAEKLRDPLYNAKAAFAISKGGTDFSFWSVFTHDTYKKFLDVDYQLKTGHARADDWDI
jgi:hypothetical protein